jgi:KDO2-lipid IV(A) lauroyltransferase
VFKNLHESFPEKSDKEIKSIARKFYRHLTDVFLEDIILMRISFKNMRKRMQYKNIELVNELYNKKKDVVMILGHYGNWEWPGSFASYTPYGLCSVYKELHNPYFDRFFKRLRGRFGNQLIEMRDSFRAVYSRKRNNQPTALALIADQSPLWKEMKFFTNFLNHPGTPIFLGTERIAKALDMAVVFAYITKPKRGHYVLEFTLLFEEVKDLPEFLITETHVRMLEKNIRERPELWLWSHKRWKRMESDLYKEENQQNVSPKIKNK